MTAHARARIGLHIQSTAAARGAGDEAREGGSFAQSANEGRGGPGAGTVRFLLGAFADEELTEGGDVFFRAENQRRSLMELRRHDVEDAIFAVDRGGARLLEEEGHRVRLVEEAELAVLALRVGGVRED